MESGQWTDQKFEWTPFQSLRCHLREHESRGENHQRLNAPGCNAIKDNKRAQAHSDRCRMRIEECLGTTPHGTERLDRRSEVINESLAGGETLRRAEKGEKQQSYNSSTSIKISSINVARIERESD